MSGADESYSADPPLTKSFTQPSPVRYGLDITVLCCEMSWEQFSAYIISRLDICTTPFYYASRITPISSLHPIISRDIGRALGIVLIVL